MPSILMVIAPSRFRDEELLEPKSIFEKKDWKVHIASRGTGEAQGMLGAKVKIDRDIREIHAKDYDSVVFVGGVGSSIYHTDRTAWRIAQECFFDTKPLGAICIAASTAANAIADLGHIKGKRMTGWPSERENIQEKGAIYTGSGVEVDGNLVTAKGPHDARKFGETIAKMVEAKGKK